ncbi:MAG: ferritin [Bacteroidetes bacterium]|jgi:ferritin|nr:ferritin [Bacteroidota bacterium]MBT6686932.1 ferritin [Bacteroidota bacterium]MBT7143214.1 ferritin [Bacteroidota bacterium]MBT7492808.1 ferritin [Bacteroidota bacterium]
MLSTKLEIELNKQLNAELFSAYLYLSMSSFLATKNLSGFSNWMKVQFEEEQAHALKLYKYIIDRGGRVLLQQIESPKNEWTDVIDVFEDIFKHEQKITSMINELVNLSMEEKDHATVNLLQWYISEQVEEEATVSDILEQLNLIEGKGAGLFMLDREMKQRVFVPIA